MATQACDKPLSERALRVVNQGAGMFGRINKEAENIFHPETNPEGKVNLGVAENKLCQDIMYAKMTEIAKNAEPISTLTASKAHGIDGFRQSLQRFLTKHFSPIQPIDFEHLFVVHGMTLVIESLAMALCEAGDYIMVFSPCYYRARTDVWERAGVDTVSVPTFFPNPSGEGYIFDLKEEVLENCYQTAKRQGKTIRAINFVNPTNPSGDMYSASHIEILLKFAHRHELHVIANEIYALTVYDPDRKYTSMLSVHWPDPGRVHFGWAFSKDFGLSGYHTAVMYTRNPKLQQYNRIVAIYTEVDQLVQLRIKALLDDEDWVEKIWLPTMRKRLRERFEGVRQTLTPIGIGVHKASGSLFAFLDMRKYLPTPTVKGEEWLVEQLISGGVLLMPGTSCEAPEPGFFRLVISLDDMTHNEGMKKIVDIVSKPPNGSKPNC